MKDVRKYGVGMVFGYGFVGTLNSCIMVAISWPIFILRTGGSPVLFTPLKMNPKFLLYLSAVYFTYGTVTTPFLAVAAAALAPMFGWVLDTLQRRLGCPRLLAMSTLSFLFIGGFAAFLVAAVVLACAVFRTPVWV